MVANHVIEPVDTPTDWCAPTVVVLKQNGDVRICVDLTKAEQERNEKNRRYANSWGDPQQGRPGERFLQAGRKLRLLSNQA